MLGTKLNKQITIKPRLDLTKYASRKNPGEQLTYRLVAMVTHLGASQHCGHYTAIGLTESGTYYNYDDSYVRPISMQNVCNTNAYIIFYEMDTQPPRNVTSTQVSGAQAISVNQKESVQQSIKMNGHTLGSSQRIIGPQLPPGYNSNASSTNGPGSVTSSSSSSPLVNGGSKLILNRNSTSLPSTSTASSSSSANGGSSKIMIHFKNNNNSSSSNNTNLVKTSAATSSVTSASATSTSSSNSTFDNLKNSSNNNSNGLHLVGTGKFQESTTSKYPLGVSTAKRQVSNLKNRNESSSDDDDDDDENEIVSSSTSASLSNKTHNATTPQAAAAAATLPSMPKLGVESTTTNTTALTNGFAKKSPAPIKSLVPYGSESDDETDVNMTSVSTANSSEQQKRLLPNPLKRRQSSSSWSSSSSSDNDDDEANDKDLKPSSNGIKIKKAASSTTTTTNTIGLSKSPAKSATDVAKKSSDTIDEIFNSIKRSNSNTATTSTNLKKKSQNQQFTVTSTTTTTDSSSTDSDDEDESSSTKHKKTKINSNSASSSSSSLRPPFKRSHSTPPSPPVVKTNSGIWQVTSLQPVTACISPTTSSPSSSSSPAAEKTPKNPKNPFATKPLVALDNAKRLKKESTNKTFVGNGYQRNTATNESAVSELLKQSHRGYGAPVLTWNGQQSEIDKEVSV